MSHFLVINIRTICID